MFQSIEVRSPKCDFCEQSAGEAKHGCKQCKACFCPSCLQQNHSRGPFREHEVLAIDKYQSDEGSVCPDHNEALKLFCESCMESLCCECKFLGRHADHTVVHLQEYAIKLKGDFDKLMFDMSEHALDDESDKHIDVTVGVNKILKNVQKSFAERKRTIDDEFQNRLSELQRTWTKLHKECDMQHSFTDKTLRSALANWKRKGDDVGFVKELRRSVSGLEVIKHRMFKCGRGDIRAQNNLPFSVPFYQCIWRIPRGSTEGFEPVCLDSSLCEEANGRLVNISGVGDFRDTSQEELRLDDYILGRVKVKASSAMPRWVSLLRESSKSSSNQQVFEQLSTVKPSPKGQSLNKLSFALGSFAQPKVQQQPLGISVSSSPPEGLRFSSSSAGFTLNTGKPHAESIPSYGTNNYSGPDRPRIVVREANSAPAAQRPTFFHASRWSTPERKSQGFSKDAPEYLAGFDVGSKNRNDVGGFSLEYSTSAVSGSPMLKLGESVAKATDAQKKASETLEGHSGWGSSGVQVKQSAENAPSNSFGTLVNSDRPTRQIQIASYQPQTIQSSRISVVEEKPQPVPFIERDDFKSQRSVPSAFGFSSTRIDRGPPFIFVEDVRSEEDRGTQHE